MSSDRPWHRRPSLPGLTRPWLAAVVLVSVALRLAAAFYLGHSVTPLPGIFDQVSYHALALRVLDGQGFSFETAWWPATGAGQPTAHWSFLYVLYLTGVYGTFGPDPLAARLIQALAVGLLQPLLTFRIAQRLFGARVGVVAAGLVAGYPYFVYYSAALLTEAFYLVAILASLDRALALARPVQAPPRRPHNAAWLQLGLALAVSVLLRQVALVVVPVILAWAWWRSDERTGPSGSRHWAAARGVGAALLVLVAAIAPWTIRNHQAFGRFVLLNTSAGFAFFWGNHPIHGTRFVPILPDGEYQRLIPAELRGLNEADLERALTRRALGFIAEDPARFAWLSASRLTEYFKFWPSASSTPASNYARVLSFGLCLPFMLAGMGLAWRSGPPLDGAPGDRRRDAGLLLGVAVVYALVHLFSWTLIRYRLPLDALLMPFAALAVVRAAAGLRSVAEPRRRELTT